MADDKIWAVLMHLGSNMWRKKGYEGPPIKDVEDFVYRDEMFCQKDVWIKVTDHLPGWGVNTLFIDIGEGVRLDSHPEIATKGAWSKDELRAELARLRAMGIKPQPKFNFSAGHSAWMGDWAYRIGTPEFDVFCKDIIEETIELFDTPEFFHIGMEEEAYSAQKNNYIAVVRSTKKKLADTKYLINIIMDKGIRPCIWMDAETLNNFGGADKFEQNMPKEVLLVPWGYREMRDVEDFEDACPHAKFIKLLTDLGFEVMPTTSTFGWHLNTKETMKICKKFMPDDKIKGYMTASWMLTRENKYYQLLNDAYTFYTAHRDVYGL